MNEEEFEALLQSITSADKAEREGAEERFTSFRDSKPILAMQCLVEIAAKGKSGPAESVALVLLRKAFARESKGFDGASADAQDDICERLLGLLEGAKGTQRKLVSACVSALATKMHQLHREWAELWDGVLGALSDSSMESSIRVSSCEVVEATSTVLAPSFSTSRVKALANGLASCVRDDDMSVKGAAFSAVADVATVLEGKRLETMKPLIGPMLEGLEATLNDGDWDGSTNLCRSIAAIVENCPDLVGKNATTVLEAMMHVASEFEVDVEARHMAIEVMVSYAETQPKVVKKVQGFVQSLLQLLFEYMVQKEYPDDWETTVDSNKGDAHSNFDIGAISVDRLGNAIPGKAVEKACREMILGNINDDKAENRVAALGVLTYSAEALAQTYASQLGGIVSAVAPRCADSDPHVREAALVCFQQLAMDLSPVLQLEHHREVLDAVKTALQDNTPRIQAGAAILLDQFFDEADNADDEAVVSILSGYYKPIVDELLVVYGKSTFDFVKLGCLSAMSSIINISKDRLAGSVKAMVPIFQQAMDSEGSTKEMTDMKDKALECTTLLAASVGWDGFSEYAEKICQHLNGYLEKKPPTDDPSMTTYLRGWTCMIECMQDRAMPYLDVAIPAILRVADVECDMEIISREVGDDEEFEDDDDDEIQFVRICRPGEGEQVVKLRKGDAERKDVAITIVKTILEMLKDRIPEKFIDSISKTIEANLAFSALSDIRETSAEALATLADAIGDSKISHLVDLALGPLMAALKADTEVSVQEQQLLALSKLLKKAPPKSVAGIDCVYRDLGQLLRGYIVQQEELGVDRDASDSDEDGDEDDDDQREALFSAQYACSEAVGSALKQDPSAASQFATHFLPIIEEIVNVDKEKELQQIGLLFLCEFVEHAPEESLEYLETIATVFLHFASLPVIETSQPALFGLNLSLQAVAGFVPQSDESSTAFAEKVHDLLLSFLRTDAVRGGEWTDSTCNAMSAALVLIDKFDICDYNDLFQALVSHLPGQGDEVEARNVHKQLVKMMTDNHPLVASNEVRKGIISLLTRPARSGWGAPNEILMDDETKEALEKLR